MKKSGVLSCFLAVSQIAGAVVVEIRHNQIRAGPKFEYDPATTKFCSFWYDNVDGRTSCKDIPDSWDITEEQWKRWNPSISESCDNFVIEKSYCVEASNEPEVPRPVSSTTSSTMSSAVQSSTTTSSTTSSNSSTTVSTTTQKDNGIPTPTPTQPGMVDNCDKFHKVQSGDTCDKIANSQGITVSEFTTWNADIGGQACTGLWRDTYVCVSVIGHEPKPTPSKPDNGIAIATPSPFQPGMVDNCNKFYKVTRGDSCASISSKHDIQIKDFTTWNPDIGGEACTGLWLDTYVCVSVIDYKPTPLTQPGIEKSCNKLHKAVAGDTCQKIVDRYGDLALAELDSYKWNPAVGNDCSGLWASYHYCVSIPSALAVKGLYHADCTGKLHRQARLSSGSGGMCFNTDCQVASLDVAAAGDCPSGQVQISYWEQPGCQGQWYGYGYTSRGTCHKLWTEGWKFKSVHLRCASERDDCVSQKTCSYAPEPARGSCM